MAEYLNEPISITLDKPRTLFFPRKMVKRAERELTKAHERDYTFYEALRGLTQFLLEDDWTKLSFTSLALLLWLGCVHEDEQLTLETVEEALPYGNPRDLIPYVVALLQAWQAVTPSMQDIPEEAPTQADPLDGSPGRTSGPLNVPALA